MGTIGKQVQTQAPADRVWDAVRDYGALDTRLVRGFVTACELDGRDRIVTFASGSIQREPIVTIDEDRHRLVYTAVDSVLGATHYNASVVVRRSADGGAVIDWVIDFLPDDIAGRLDQAMELGAAAMRATLADPG